jgi:hypothetical protein
VALVVAMKQWVLGLNAGLIPQSLITKVTLNYSSEKSSIVRKDTCSSYSSYMISSLKGKCHETLAPQWRMNQLGVIVFFFK